MQAVASRTSRSAAKPAVTPGKEARVPFKPREDRPVYCSDCFAKMKEEG